MVPVKAGFIPPLLELAECLRQSPFSEFADDAGFLSQGNEFIRGNQTVTGPIPPHQGFDADKSRCHPLNRRFWNRILLTGLPALHARAQLKIDRSFIAGLGTNQADATLVETVVRLARGLGMTCVAEGVENARQMNLLRGLGCDLAQGYHLGRPQAGPDLSASLNQALAQAGES